VTLEPSENKQSKTIKARDPITGLDRVSALEHQADDAERLLAEAALRHAADFRGLHICAALGDKLEKAADALKRSSL